MQLVTVDEMMDDDDGGADVDGTLGEGACANAPVGAATVSAAANRIIAWTRMIISVDAKAGP